MPMVDSAFSAGTRFPNTFLDTFSSQVRGKTIPWEASDKLLINSGFEGHSYVNAGLISGEELPVLLEMEKARSSSSAVAKSFSADYLEEFGAGMVSTLLSILPKVNNIEVVQYILVILDDLLPAYEKMFTTDSSSSDNNNAMAILAKIVSEKSEDFSTCKAARIYVTLACSSAGDSGVDSASVSSTYLSVTEWIVAFLQKKDQEKLQIVSSQCLQSLLTQTSYKVFLFEPVNMSLLDQLLRSLAQVLTASAGDAQKSQLSYQILNNWWILSYNGPRVAAKMSMEYGVTAVISDIAKSAAKEKIVRMCVAIFRNLLERAAAENTSALIGCKILPFMDVLTSRKYVDEEILADIKYVKEQLTLAFQNLSSFDEYASEVRSGQLDWSPPHQSELFWRENVLKFHERDMEMLKLLTKILTNSSNPKSLAVACHDIGQYVKHNPSGKKYVQELGGKQSIMHLMTHEDAEVKYHALSAVQKYMMNIWNV